MLYEELLKTDLDEYRRLLRVSREQLLQLMTPVEPRIRREDTIMRRSISAETLLQVTLRYLASGFLRTQMCEARGSGLFSGKAGSKKTAITCVRGTSRRVVSTGPGRRMIRLRPGSCPTVFDAFPNHLQRPLKRKRPPLRPRSSPADRGVEVDKVVEDVSVASPTKQH
ncbi:uncharacterized protein LOC125942581 [Dermacentor silvarum]|uniref:uncharacterized protein LOC125942581 n=1 Tax=Dermacentor silvarum TaxID=543639 RepID=UPI0021009FC5|nr:uncharacterized protein LOC125942581 [Dermacentor silvarum]